MGENYEPAKEALYSFIVLTKEGELIPGAELLLKSDHIEEVLTTDQKGTAFYFTQNPETIEVTVNSLPGNYTAEEGVAATTGTISAWFPIYVK